MVKPIPDGYHAITPYLAIDGAAKAIEFYKKVFDATERMRFDGPGGTIGHAEIQIGDSVIMLSDSAPEYGAVSPKQLGGSPVGLSVYVTDCDAVFQRAVDAGAEAVSPPQDQFYGDRSASVTDPFGHKWHIMTHIKDMTVEEMQAAMPKG